MTDSPLSRAYRAHRAIRTMVDDIDRNYLEFVEGDPTKVFDEYPGLLMRKAEYVDGYMNGAFEATDSMSKHLHDLHDALVAIDLQMNAMTREAAQ
jgi:hypothetical protein